MTFSSLLIKQLHYGSALITRVTSNHHLSKQLIDLKSINLQFI